MTTIELSIIGLGFHVGEFGSIEDFMKGLIVSKKAFPRGINHDATAVLQRDVAIEKTMTEALKDANLSENEKKKTAFILHHATSPTDAIFAVGEKAAKVASHFGLGDLSYTTYDGENTIFRGLALAQHLIAEKLAPVVAICTAPPINESSTKVEGATVLILKEKEQALQDHHKIYASISGLAIVEDELNQETITEAFIATLKDASIEAGQLRVADIPSEQNADYHNMITDICHEQVADYLVKENFLLAEIESFMGVPLAIAPSVIFIKHALQLFFYYVFIFETESNQGVSFFVSQEPALWNRHDGKRTSAIMCAPQHSDGYLGLAVLTECIDTMEEDLACTCDRGLLPLTFTNPNELCTKLLNLQNNIEVGIKSQQPNLLKGIYDDTWHTYQAVKNPIYTAVLIFDTLDALKEEATALLASKETFTKENGFDPNFKYESKRGSYFTANPFGKEAKIAYMNPPGSAQHMLLFYEMLMLFPRYRNAYSTFINTKFFIDMDELDYRFGRFAMELCMIGLVDHIAKHRLGITPDILTGASLGEIATLFAYDLIDTDLQSGLNEPVMKLLRSFRDTYVYTPFEMGVKYVKADIKAIHQAVDETENIYVLLEASPEGAFISGKATDIEQFLEKNRFMAWTLDLDSAIHTPHVEQFYDQIYEAALQCENLFREDLDLKVYSTYYKKPVENTIEAIAEFAAAILVKPCDFHGLLELLYEEGNRIFIDMSTGGTCLAWAQETFSDRDTLAFSIYPSFIDARGSLLKTYAKLLSNQANINVETFLNAFDFSFMEDSSPQPVKLNLSLPAESENMTVWPLNNLSTNFKKADEPITVNTSTPPVEIKKQEIASDMEADLLSAYATLNIGFHQNAFLAYQRYLENEKALLAQIQKTNKKQCLWDYDDIMEIIAGSPSKVWGARYAPLDQLKKRARLPLPPFMFVDRVVGIDAKFGEFRPSSIDIEFEITDDCILMMSEHKISYILLTEASHVAILLLAYIGIDLIYDGEVSYRILDTHTYLYTDFPAKGDTVCSKLEFVEFIQSGSMTLVKSRFTSYSKAGKLLLSMELMGGFFTEDDLKRNMKGILPSKKSNHALRPSLMNIEPKKEPLIDMEKFYNGEYGALFYPYRTSTTAERLNIHPKIRMVDRIISIDFKGGAYGLGCIIAEKDYDETHWAFDVHFKNDPVFPGSLLAEATNHIQLLFALNTGFAVAGEKYVLSCDPKRPIKSIFRGQVRPIKSTIRFVQTFKEIVKIPKGVIIVSDCDIFWQGSNVARTEDLSLVIETR